jgi:hypothetical protein
VHFVAFGALDGGGEVAASGVVVADVVIALRAPVRFVDGDLVTSGNALNLVRHGGAPFEEFVETENYITRGCDGEARDGKIRQERDPR